MNEDYINQAQKERDEFLKRGRSNNTNNETKGTKEPNIHIPRLSEFVLQDFGTTDWLIEDLIPMGGSVIAVAKRESYKTWMALHLALCVSKGVPAWNTFATIKSNVLYISNDDPARNFRNRVQQFAFDDSFYIYHQSLPPFSVDQDNNGFTSVKTLIKEHNINFVIVDILRNTHNRDANSDKDAKVIFDKFKELREVNVNLVFLFLIHPSKEQPMERKFAKRQFEEAVGSYYWEASVDTVLSLKKITDENLNDKVLIHITKNKQSERKIAPFVGIKKDIDNPVEFIYEESIPQTLKIEESKQFILGLLEGESLERQKIIDAAVESNICGSRMVEEALKILLIEKLVTHTKSRPHIYSLISNDETVQDDSANRNSIYTVRNAESEFEATETMETNQDSAPDDSTEQLEINTEPLNEIERQRWINTDLKEGGEI